MMGVFNNLVLFDQQVAQNSMGSIVPDLANGWSWSEEGTELTMPLRHGVRWHDGKPFTAQDVQCTWELLSGRSAEELRLNPRKTWYSNLEEVTANGDYQVTFHLKPPQPSFLALLASGWSPVYLCHVLPRDMRVHPIGTGPFKFVEFRPNERRRRLVWDIERKLIEDDVRPVLFHPRGVVCNQPWVKGMTQIVNGIYNGSRFEEVWLDE